MSDDTQKIFTLTEAERVRHEVEPLLLEAVESRRRLAELDEKLQRIVHHIQRMGGVLVAIEDAASARLEHDRQLELIRGAIDRIHSTGCLVKDLDVGLLDFPGRIGEQEIYYCWKIGEDRIRFYHAQDAGFAGRTPIDPRDAEYGSTIQ
jgi:hypothetical protein